MKRLNLVLILGTLCLVLALTLAWSGAAQAAPLAKTVIANTFTLEAGETLDENLTILAGTVVLEKGSTVNGDISLTGGTLEVSGLVDGDINATGGTLSLKKSAHITGAIMMSGVAFSQADGAQIDGDVRQLENALPGIPGLPERVLGNGLSTFWSVIWFLVRIFVFSALAVLVVMFFPRHMDRTRLAIVAQPLTTGGLGLLTVIVAPFVVLLLSITIILIPIALAGIAVLGLIALFGWIALGLETGKRLAAVLNQDWAPPLSAGLGTMLLTFVLFSINFLACIGWIFPFAASVVGLGAALLTVMGTRTYPDTTPIYRPPSPPAVVDSSFAAEPLPDEPPAEN